MLKLQLLKTEQNTVKLLVGQTRKQRKIKFPLKQMIIKIQTINICFAVNFGFHNTVS